MRDIKEIIIHCSATREGRNFTAADIDQWHKDRGYQKIGYHFVILLSGKVERGRELWEVGAHALKHNAYSIGICYIGGCDSQMKPKDTRTPEQTVCLIKLLNELKVKFPNAKIIGHNELSNKACPSFDVQEWLKTVEI
jgi:N-acetylmuramoyl-L-alanine amidase